MSNSINKERVKKNFSSIASNYDQVATLQSEVAQALIYFIASRKASRIIDIGTGTGNILWKVAKRFPSAQTHGCDLAFGMIKQASSLAQSRQKKSGHAHGPFFLQADAERLPYCSLIFDLVLSNVAYQWIQNYRQAFQEVHRLMKPGAEFCFSIFIEGTLSELYSSFRHIGYFRGHPFVSCDVLKKFLRMSEFSHIFMKELIFQKEYPDVFSLLCELKKMGASNAASGFFKGLGGRKKLQEMINYYEENFTRKKGIKATYQVALIRCKKLQPKQLDY